MLGDDQRVPLRLTVTRGVLGMELYEPIEVGPLDVNELALTLPNLKFPVDLSGGVPRFRHRRGELEHAALALDFARLSAFASRRIGDTLGALVRPVSVFARPHGLGLGFVARERALAFDLLWAPEERHARFVVSNARGVGLSGAALGFVLRALDTILAGIGVRRGRVISIFDAGAQLGRMLLPAVGARAPASQRVRFGPFVTANESASVELDATFGPLEANASTMRALELAELVRGADDALASGESDEARAGYLAALDHAPRQPELVRLVAEIDVLTPEHAEAALGLVVESMRATNAGVVGAELLWRIGDFDGARQALTEVAEREPFAPLAALFWCRAAEREPSPVERRIALDRAVALSPGLELPRARRLASRLERGDSEGALSDAEHLEAMSRGARAKHEQNLGAARAFFAAGFVREARRCYERALRYAPDDARATAGLARSLLEVGLRERATTLLARAVSLSERTGQPDADALIDLSSVLASDLKDLPQAIARVRQVSASSPRHAEARRLEARWRADLGDIAGASLAYGRMREAIELALVPPPKAVEFLLEAADFERDSERDVLAAERHLGVALRVAPRDASVAQRYREVAAEALELQKKRRRDG